MSKPTLLTDTSGKAAQLLSPTGDGSEITTSGTSANVALPTGLSEGEVCRVAATQDCYIKFGTSGLTAAATDILMPAGVEYFTLPSGATHAAAIQVDTAGVVQFMECN